MSMLFRTIGCLVLLPLVYSAVYTGQLSWRCHAFHHECEVQIDIIESIAEQVPDDEFQQRYPEYFALFNVWHNALQAEYYPAGEDPRNFDEMKEVTRQLQQIADRATPKTAVNDLKFVLDLLLEMATKKAFVTQYRKRDVEMLNAVEQVNSTDDYHDGFLAKPETPDSDRR